MADEDFNDDEEEDEQDVLSDYQLGFCEEGSNELFNELNWQKWDGGQVGGRPSWLDKKDLPHPDELKCAQCGEPMKFLLQIYCPLETPPNAFHRALYLFCCKRASCVSSGSVKCLRSQLNIDNPFYPKDPKSPSAESHLDAQKASICDLCGCRAPNRCSSCQTASYCSRSHQKQHWKTHKLVCGKAIPNVATGDSINNSTVGIVNGNNDFLFPVYELSVSSEELVDSADDSENKEELVLGENTTIWDDALTEGGPDEEEDAKLTQADYDNALGSETKDPSYIRFLSRVRRGGADQVLRYSRWNLEAGPLLLSSSTVQQHNA